MHKSLDFLTQPSIYLQQIASLNLCNLVSAAWLGDAPTGLGSCSVTSPLLQTIAG